MIKKEIEYEKVALITEYWTRRVLLSRHFVKKGYEVHGLIRRSSSFNTSRIDHLINDQSFSQSFFFHYGDLTDASSLNRLLEKIQPNEIYNLAAQSHVQVSFQIPDYTAQVDALGTLRFLDAIRETRIDTKFIRPQQVSFMEKFKKFLKVKKHRFIQDLHTVLLNFMGIGL